MFIEHASLRAFTPNEPRSNVKTDRPVPLRDLSLLAHGGVIVEGYLRIVSDGPLGSALQPPADAMLVANFSKSLRGPHGTLELIPHSPLLPDGWRDWRSPILSVVLNGLVPDLARRRYRSEAESFVLTMPDTPLFTIYQRYPADGSFHSPLLVTAVSSVEGTASLSPAGLRLRMTGPVEPTKAGDDLPALTDARLECDVLIPWTYLVAVGSDLSMLNLGSVATEQGPWRPDPIGPGSLALSRGSAYFDGHLTLPGQRVDIYPDGPFLRARISDSITELQGVRELRRMADGSVWPSTPPHGPELTLQLGYDDYARMLGRNRKAVLELRGEGIGHVLGQTGRDWGGQQFITACQITLARGNDGLQIDLTGKLAPTTDGYESLGPKFSASMFVPTGYLMLRHWPIEGLLEDWRKRFGIEVSRL